MRGCLSLTPHLARNPGMCLDWESNRQPFGSQASTQSTEPHQPGLYLFLYVLGKLYLLINMYDFTHKIAMNGTKFQKNASVD